MLPIKSDSVVRNPGRRPDESLIKPSEIVALCPIADGVLNGEIGAQSYKRSRKRKRDGIERAAHEDPAGRGHRKPNRQSDDDRSDQPNRTQRDP
jgi:hypothetical protein